MNVRRILGQVFRRRSDLAVSQDESTRVDQEESPFACLVGEELDTVAFVMDYVEFHFNGPVVRAFTKPIVHTAMGDLRFPAAGSRDALCTLIGQVVENVFFDEEQSVEFYFRSGDRLLIPMDLVSRQGHDALDWQPDNNPDNMIIW